MRRLGEAFKGRLEFAYHRTNETNIPSIVKNGFIPGYGDMYGKGWYMCYDLESQLNPIMTSYGNGVIKAQIFDKGVLIFDYNVSKELYGSKYTLVDQLIRQGIFPNEAAVPFFYKDMSKACELSFQNPSQSAAIAYHCFVKGANASQYLMGKNPREYSWGEGTSCLNSKGVPRINKITAIVFSGNHDGNVVVGYSPNTVLPVAYAIIDESVCYDYKNGSIGLDDIEFTPLKDYEIAEERARQARELYERLGALRNSSIISLDLRYNKMTAADFEKNFRWIARDSKVTNAEIVIDENGKFLFVGGSWDNGLWQGDQFGVADGRSFDGQPKFKGGVFTKGEFLGDWEFGKFIGGVFKGRWRGRGSKSQGGVWSASPECWDPAAIAYSGSKFLYELKAGSGKFIESELTPPEFYKSLEGPQVQFSPDKKTLIKFDPNFTGTYTIPDGVEEIGDQAFQGCKLKGVIFSNSVKNIGVEAFGNCSNLSKIQFGNGLKKISGYAFYNCISLGQVILPTGLQDIMGHAFESSSLSTIVIPNSVKYLGIRAFNMCDNLSSVKLSNALLGILEATFAECRRLFNVEIPDSCIEIGESAFTRCNKLRTIKLPNRLREIGPNAFYGSGINEIEIPSLVHTVDVFAFAYCNIKTFKMSPISSFSLQAFYNTKLNDFVFNGTLAQLDNEQAYQAVPAGTSIKCKDGEVTK